VLPVNQFGKRGARHAEGCGGGGNAQARRLDALAEYEAAGGCGAQYQSDSRAGRNRTGVVPSA
jgi:hypothetical protein